MKKVFALSLCLMLSVFLATGCGKDTKENNSTSKEEKKTEEVKSKGNCSVFECIEKTTGKDTLEDMNKIIGFEGTVLREGTGWKTYSWELNDTDSVETTFYSTSSTTKINFKDERIKNSKVSFAKYDELKKALNNRESISYDKVKELFGGEEGTLVEKDNSGSKYRWVNAEGGYLNVSFNSDKSKCTMVMGRM